MRTASAGLITMLATANQMYWADCWDVTLSDGTQLFYTSADQNLVFNSGSGNHTYLAAPPSFERNGVRCAIGLEVDSLDLTIKAGPTDTIESTPLLQALIQGKLDNAQLILNRVPMTTFGDTSNGGVVMFGGNIADISEIGRSHAKLSVHGFTQKLSQPFPKNVYQPGCRWTLFDAGCTLNAATFAISGTVQASANNNVYNIVTALGRANGYFNLGTISFTSGQNSGLSRSVRSYDGTNVVLYLKLPNVPQTGDAFTIFPGCDKTQSTCTTKFSNIVNFAGEPYVPVAESAI